jgi:hypothetical protein
MAHVVSSMIEILVSLVFGEHRMKKSAIHLDRIRQVALDGLMVLGMVLMLSAEFPR